MRAERDRLDLIIDSVADPILVTDPAGALVHDEHAGGAAVRGAREPSARARRARAGQRRPLLRLRLEPLLRLRGGAAARRDRPRRSGDGPRPARGGDLRQDLLRARRGHRDRHRPARPHGGDREGAPLRGAQEGLRPPRGARAGGHRGAGRPERAAAAAAPRAGAGLGRQVAVPGQHVPRVPHAPQRHPRATRACCCRACPARWARSRSATSAAWTATPATCWPSSTTSSTSPASRPGRCRCT